VFDGGGSSKFGDANIVHMKRGIPSFLNENEKKIEILNKLTGKSLTENTIQFHIPFHNYAGPGTNTISNILNNVLPVDTVDSLALKHDLDYLLSKTVSDIKKADDSMVSTLLHKDNPFDPSLPSGEETLVALALKLKGLIMPNYGLESNVKLNQSEYDFLTDYIGRK